MDAQGCVEQLKSTKEFFDRSTSCLGEADSDFVPFAGAMTAAQQVAHVAQTVEWFIEGAFRPEGFDLDFEKHAREVRAVESLAEARDWLDRAFATAIAQTAPRSGDELAERLPEGPVMGGAPRFSVFGAVQDHTAHHRGVLTMYSRLCGHTPPMPYGDM